MNISVGNIGIYIAIVVLSICIVLMVVHGPNIELGLIGALSVARLT